MNPSSSSLFSTSMSKWDPNSFDDEPSSCKRPKNDIFINYSFEDVGKGFVSHLRGALIRCSFTISDHTVLPLGQDMHLELSKAIDESEIYVVVFSPNYASSTTCLDELVDVMDRFYKFDERKVLPVFFKVDPSHVRSQQGPFMEAFQAYETDVDPVRVQEWRQALKDAGQLSGLTFPIHGDEGKFVSEIVKDLEKMQRPQELHVTDHPVGIGSRAEELISTLRLDLQDRVLVVAVFGFSGIGKTTIVKEAFNRIAASFDLSCFLADIYYICQVPNWKVELPKALLSCLTHENKFSIMSNHNEGVTKIRRLVRGRKVLLVLDYIDSFQQLEVLGICPKWFYEGSRIIVTTRGKGSLGNIPYESYHTKLLNRRESLNLFTRLMFLRDDPGSTMFIKEVVGRAGGLPLVLKVWSRHFQQYEREQWPSILETLKGIPHGDVQKQLQMSYDSLTPRLKKLFLDIACFFDGMEKDLVVKVLEDEDLRFFPNNEIQYLVDKSLVEITLENRLQMHHAIREMGHEIVRQENEDEPGLRTRLWDLRDVKLVLTECSGTKSIESIRVAPLEYVQGVTQYAFRKMSNLRLIHLYGNGYYSSYFSHDEMTPLCFKKLKYMFWEHFPSKSLDNIEMCNVVVLQIKQSNLDTLWEGTKSLKKLRILDVSYSASLTKTGNFSGLENLKELYFNGCVNLRELHSSIGYLQKLAILDLRSSILLERIPWEMIGKLASLRELRLGKSGITLEPDEVNDPLLYSLKECPITTLELYGCVLSKISGGVVSLASLKHLHLYRITFSSHHDSLIQLHALNTIEFEDCDTIQSIPNLPKNITSIKALDCSSLVNLPCNITELKSLTCLYFSLCHKLGAEDPRFFMKITGLTNLSQLSIIDCCVSHVPSEIGNLVSLKDLNLSYNSFSSLPDSLSNLSQLIYLNIDDCRELRLRPLLPSNLTNILISCFSSLDVMSSASTLTKLFKSLEKLKILDVSYSASLTKTGNFSGLENLKERYFNGCVNLRELHSSIDSLQKLAILDLRSSILLERIPWEMIGKLASLRELRLGKSGITLEPDEVNDPLLYSLKECPITTLEIYGCILSKISGGVVSLASLKHLHLYRITFSSHPASLIQLHALNTIEFEDCDTIQSIPNLPKNITSIKALDCSSLVNLPCNITELKSLTCLYFSLCHKLGAEDPRFFMKITGLTNLSQLSIIDCCVSHVPSEIGNLVSLKDLNLSYNSFSSLPDSLSNLSQLIYLNIDDCRELRLRPLLPSNLTNILEPPFSNRILIQLPCTEKVPDWCSYQNMGDVLSFVAPVCLDNNICGIILCANASKFYDRITIIPKIYNKTKNTSHHFKAYTSHHPTAKRWKRYMCVMSYPLDDTTLMVEPGDSVAVVVQLSQGLISSCGLCLIYESDVVDC